MDETKYLGTAPIKKLLLKFAVPCVISLLIGAFYNIVDQIFIGNSSLGYLGNAATGISFPIICIANAFAWCVGDGAAAYLSICAGRQDSESAHKCVGTGLSATVIISIILSSISIIFCEELMSLFGASDATLTLACDYFKIIALFFPAYLMFNVMGGMIRADGSPNFAMAATISGALINIVLDPICIFLLDWGIKGAAVATVTGEVISFVMCIFYFRHPKSFTLSLKSFKINFKMLKTLIFMGGSTFIIQISIVVMSLLSNIMLFKYGSMSIYGSDIPISVFSIQNKVYTIVVNIAVGIALGGQPILGYNFGAKKMDRVREAYRLILITSVLFSLAATLVFIFCPQVIIGIFGKQNALYMDFAVKSFRIFLCLCFVTSFIKISSIFFQSIGRPIESMLTSVIRDMLCFCTFTVILCNIFEAQKSGAGIYGILFASPLADIVAGTVIAILTVRFFKKLKKENKESDESAVILDTHPGTVITFAREHGTGGKQIGKLVAQKLGIPFYCKELTAIAAKESGLAQEFISKDYDSADEILHQIYLSTEVIQQGIIAQEKIIKKIAAEGSCVIVGRAANYVLKDQPNVLRVFLYAPKDLRIKNIMDMYGDSYESAKKHMIKSDESRRNYYRSIAGSEWNDEKNYDLCIDVSIGRDKVADMIVNFVNSSK